MTATYQALRGLGDTALQARLLAGLPQPEANESRYTRAAQSGPWWFRALNGGERVETRRADGKLYLVAGLPYSLAVHADAPFACSCVDSRRHARQGVRCKHVWARVLAALGRVPLDPAGETDLLLLWGGSAPDTPAPDHFPLQKGDHTMSNNGDWRNRQYKHGDETSAYPYVQWVNNGGNIEPRQPMGGFAAPLDQNLAIPGTFAHLHHKNGDHTEVIYSPTLTVAVVATRFAWVKDGRRVAYESGARGKLQVLGLVQTQDGPKTAMLTFTGMASRYFGAARKAFMGQVRQATAGAAPSWAFWMTLKADGTEMVGKTAQSSITKLALAREVDLDQDYIGGEQVDVVEALLDQEARDWVAAWSRPGEDVNGTDDGNGSGYELPANSKGYRTLDEAVNANDRETVARIMSWAEGQGNAALAEACQVALSEMQDDIPF